MTRTIYEQAEELRHMLKELEERTRELMTHHRYGLMENFEGQHQEMKGQTMLAVRHIEDARMRLGKVCQYADDGVSCYDKG